ncbi:MAG: hypothetical protein ACJ8F7_00195 [Gemmataceae bacterium]
MLSQLDEINLGRYQARLQLLRDRVRGVVEGWATGLYVWGSGGIGKSHTVQVELERLQAPYVLTNGRLTGRALFDLLMDHPDVVHVLEDMESLLRDKNAANVLRSALWPLAGGQRRQHAERPVTWGAMMSPSAKSRRLEFTFTGGIILTMNAPLDDLPELRALRTRIAHLQLQPTADEVVALMRKIASQGYAHGEGQLPPGECAEVCEYVIASCLETGRHPDLRLLIHGFHDRLQWQAGHATSTWQELLESRVRGHLVAPERPAGRGDRLAAERALAREIRGMAMSGAEKERLWKEKTQELWGEAKSARAFYRRLEG